MKRILVCLISMAALTGCNNISDLQCSTGLEHALVNFLDAARKENTENIKNARNKLKNAMSDCEDGAMTIRIEMLGEFSAWDFYIYTHQLKKLKDVVSKGKVDITLVSGVGGSTPLHEAAFYGTPDMVRYFLAQQIDVDAKDRFDNTPLMAAMSGLQGDFANASVLLAHGADINAESMGGGSALDSAIANENIPAVEFLLANGAAADCSPEVGPSTRELVIKTKNDEITQLLDAELQACQ